MRGLVNVENEKMRGDGSSVVLIYSASPLQL